MPQSDRVVHPFDSLPFRDAPIATDEDIAASPNFWVMTVDGLLKQANVGQMANLQYKLPYPGAQPLPFAFRAGFELNIQEFGAKGDGVVVPLGDKYASLTDAQADYPQATSLNDTVDWAALANAVAICQGTTRVLVIPDGDYMMGTRTADLKGVPCIRCTGRLVSGVGTNGIAAEIGTAGNAMTDLVSGDISLRVAPDGAANVQRGATGIRVKGAYRTRFRLFVERFNIGVWLNPTSDVGSQLLADCLFEQLGVYSADTGLLFDHNTQISNVLFLNSSLDKGLVAAPYAGVRVTSQGDTNSVVLEQPHIGAWPTPVRASGGRGVYFRKARLEASGPIVIEGGNTSTAKMVVVETAQKGDLGKLVHPITFDGRYPCFSVNPLGPMWHREVLVTRWDFFNYNPVFEANRKQYCPKLQSQLTPGHFEIVTIDANANTFALGNNDHGLYYTRVSKGDVLWPVVQYVRGVPAGNMAVLTVTACDVNKNPLAAILVSDPIQTPYIGMGSDDVGDWHSGAASGLTVLDVNAGSQLYVSVNRAEVKYLRFELLPTVAYASFELFRLLRDAGDMVALVQAPSPVDMKYINDPAADLPDRFGQFGVLRGAAPKFYFAATPTSWMNIDANISSIGPTSARPASMGTLNKGWRHFDTDLQRDVVWDGAQWDDPINYLDQMVVAT